MNRLGELTQPRVDLFQSAAVLALDELPYRVVQRCHKLVQLRRKNSGIEAHAGVEVAVKKTGRFR